MNKDSLETGANRASIQESETKLQSIVNFFRKKIPNDYLHFLYLFVASRIVLAFVGTASRILLAPYHNKPDYWLYSKYKWLDMWGAWDTGWYLDIANRGYSALPYATAGQSNIGFFPLYSALTWLISQFTGNLYAAGLIVSNVSFLVATFFLYKLIEKKWNSPTARWCLLFTLFAPVGFIFSAALSESLFMLTVVLCFYFSFRNKWLIVGIAGYFAALTRPQGLFLIVPLIIEFMISFFRKSQKSVWQIIFLLLIPLGTFTFAYYTYTITGDWKAYVHSKQQGWNITIMKPWDALRIGLNSNDFRVYINSIFTVIVLILVLVQAFKIPLSWTIFSLILMSFPLRYGDSNIVSMFRYSLPIFPLYVILSGSGLNEQAKTGLLLLMAMLQTLFMISFANGFDLII